MGKGAEGAIVAWLGWGVGRGWEGEGEKIFIGMKETPNRRYKIHGYPQKGGLTTTA